MSYFGASFFPDFTNLFPAPAPKTAPLPVRKSRGTILRENQELERAARKKEFIAKVMFAQRTLGQDFETSLRGALPLVVTEEFGVSQKLAAGELPSQILINHAVRFIEAREAISMLKKNNLWGGPQLDTQMQTVDPSLQDGPSKMPMALGASALLLILGIVVLRKRKK